MSVKEWAASCADRVKALLKDIENGTQEEFKPLSSRMALTSTTIHINTGPDALTSGIMKISKDQVPWAATCEEWYVIVRATPEVLAEVIKQLQGHDLMQHDDTTLWVISKKMPASERKALTK